MTDAIENSQKLRITKNIAQMNVVEKPLIKRLGKSTTQKKKDYPVRKEHVRLVAAKIFLVDIMN
jgi:hypothetical protein